MLIFTFSKSAIETLEKSVKYVHTQWCRSSVFIVNFETYQIPFSSVSNKGFEQVNVSWEV